MHRGKFILTTLALYPLAAFAKNKKHIGLRPGKGFKVKAGEGRFGEHFKMKGVTSNTLDLKVSTNDTSGDLAIFEQTGLSPNGGPPLHIHHFQDEIFYVIEGEYLFQVGEKKQQLKTGDTIFLPRKVPHAFIQLTEKGKLIVTYQPAGKMEEFFKKTDRWEVPPTQDEIRKVFEECEMKVIGPPLQKNETLN